MDPIVTDDASVGALRRQIAEVVKQVDPRMTIHDFRVVRGTTHTNLIFDAVLPFSSGTDAGAGGGGDPEAGAGAGQHVFRRGDGGAQLYGLKNPGAGGRGTGRYSQVCQISG